MAMQHFVFKRSFLDLFRCLLAPPPLHISLVEESNSTGYFTASKVALPGNNVFVSLELALWRPCVLLLISEGVDRS